ncbi:MAG: hypothetical protein HPY55_00965 [Firmicutes bacterium]|nr:hypothetical protein [Bacillota bacterium]
MSMLATEGAPSKRIRWKAGKEAELWQYVQGRLAAGANVSEALKGFADDNGISWLTARWKYYRLKQNKGSGGEDASPVATEEPAPVTSERDGDTAFRALTLFLKSATSLDSLELSGFLSGLATLAEMALTGKTASGELAVLRTRQRELTERVRAYEEKLAGAAGRLSAVRAVVDDWLKMPGVDRVTSLEEFTGRLTGALGQLEALLQPPERLS